MYFRLVGGAEGHFRMVGDRRYYPKAPLCPLWLKRDPNFHLGGCFWRPGCLILKTALPETAAISLSYGE